MVIVGMVELLLRKCASIEAMEEKKYPIVFASQSGHTDVVQLHVVKQCMIRTCGTVLGYSRKLVNMSNPSLEIPDSDERKIGHCFTEI